MTRATWGRIAVAAAVLVVILTAPALAQDSSTPPIGWWPLNETVGAGTAVDAMGTYPLTTVGAGVTFGSGEVPGGMPGTSVAFNRASNVAYLRRPVWDAGLNPTDNPSFHIQMTEVDPLPFTGGRKLGILLI